MSGASQASWQDPADIARAQLLPLGDLCNRGRPAVDQLFHPASRIRNERDEVRIALRRTGVSAQDDRTIATGPSQGDGHLYWRHQKLRCSGLVKQGREVQLNAQCGILESMR